MKIFTYLISLNLLLSSCCYSPIPRRFFSKEILEKMQTNATVSIVREHEKYAKEKYGMELYDEPIVYISDKVFSVDVAYDSGIKVELDEARKIHLDLLNTLIDRFNSDPKFREYMKVYPFSERNVFLQLGYYDYTGMAHENPYIKVTFNGRSDDILRYFRKEDRVRFPCEPFYEEPIEEAVKKLRMAND